MRATILVALFSLGCTAEVGEAEPARTRWSFRPLWEIEEDSWDPKYPSCIPSQEALDDWDPEAEQDLIGRFRILDDLGANLRLFADGHYEWRFAGCTGTSFEVGLVSRFDDWVVLKSDTCRWGFPSTSTGAFLLRELDGDPVLVPADDEARFMEALEE